MKRRSSMAYLAIPLYIALLQGGCAPVSRPAHFYVLRPSTQIQPFDKGNIGNIIVGIGPVALPTYLDRPQIVTADRGAEVHIDEFERWAGSLREDIGRVVAADVSAALDSDRVVAYPWSQIAVDCQVQMEILRFEGTPGQEAAVKVQWAVLDEAKGGPALRISEFKRPTAGPGFDALVEAWGLTLSDLSQEIAGVLTDLKARSGSSPPNKPTL